MTTYKLKFLHSALREWKKLAEPLKKQLKAKLEERLENPRVPSCSLFRYPNHYKIKLRAVGYRLVYEVVGDEVCIYVICVGRRDKVYDVLKKRVQ
ncbi:MAG: type II toxin-antitoxin system RelE/ParE family toxin [Deltaproteobacteria bacterium]|nr:type II toxin-antitoxin system RelE/ParE family toxin [Deltaproteobacteria bacterium]